MRLHRRRIWFLSGQQITQIDGQGRETHFGYDKLGRRTARRLPSNTAVSSGERWFYDCNESGVSVTTGDKRPNKMSHVDFMDRQTIMVFDAAGRLDQKRNASTVLVDYDYTPSGQRSRMRDNLDTPSPRTTRYVYDELGRLRIKSSSHKEGGTTVEEGALTYDFDTAKGDLQSISAKKGYTFPAVEPYTLANVPVKATDPNPNGAYMTYTYDDRHRPVKVNADASPATTADVIYSYDPVGSQARMTYRNGVETAYSYNTRNHLTLINSTLSVSTVASLTYDDASWAGRRLANSGLRRRVVESINGVASRTVDYDYDNLNRLTQEIIGGTSIRYNGDGMSLNGYDPVGNRRSRISTVPGVLTTPANVAFDVNDWLDNDANANNTSTRFDANGNTLVPDLNGDGIVDEGYTYTYDLENRLVSAIGGGNTITLVYDGDGNRVKKTVNGAATDYLVDDRNLTGYAQVLEERPALGGDPTVTYVYGLDLISQKRGTATHYYGYDGLGTVRYLTDGTSGSTTYAQVTDTYTYDAFGILIEIRARNLGLLVVVPMNDLLSTPNNYLFAGEQYDSHLGLYYNRARYYKPELGRFWTMDTYEGNQSDPLSLHKYLYAHDNPVNGVDPSGNMTMTELVVNVAIITTLANLTTTAIASHLAFKGGDIPKWVVLSFGLNGGAYGAMGEVGVDVVFNANKAYIYIVPAAGLSPLTVFQNFNMMKGKGALGKVGGSLTFGVIFNMTDPQQYTQHGFTATWPLSVLNLMPKALFKRPKMWGALTELAKRTHNVRPDDLVAQVGFSTSGPSSVKVGLRSNSFSWTYSYAFGPYDFEGLSSEWKDLLSEYSLPNLFSSLTTGP